MVAFGREVDVSHNQFGSYARGYLEYLHVDLLRLAGVVAYADRSFRRTPASSGWAREIHIEMTVSDRDLFDGATEALVECLEYVSGDRWSFAFARGDKPPIQGATGVFDAPQQVDAVVPFSGGLDSFLLRADLRRQGTKALLLTARTSSLVRRAAHEAAVATGVDPLVAGLPVKLRCGPHAESTFRTRTFVFGCASAVSAALFGASRVLIAENGQGAIGGSLVPFGSEAPYRTTHPLFTERLRRFLDCLGINVHFEHPYVWRTKGSVLRDLIVSGSEMGWQQTKSCSRNLRRTKQVPDDRACGICGNCLLRRLAVDAAGASDRTQYHWNLDAADLSHAAASGGTKPTTSTDRAIAACSVLAMDGFARLEDNAPEMQRNAFSMSQLLEQPVERIAEMQSKLRDAHRSEWSALLGGLSSQSWVRDYVGGP
jgi:7-cyano-7-deazaguanine synthase in queuosine biosynthesis